MTRRRRLPALVMLVGLVVGLGILGSRGSARSTEIPDANRQDVDRQPSHLPAPSLPAPSLPGRSLQEPSVDPGLHAPDPRFAGLRWRFTRLRYTAHSDHDSMYRARYWSQPWAVDAPAAEQNFSRRVRTVTAIQVDEPIVLTLEDPEIWENPWIYIVEPGTLSWQEAEVPILREFLLRGGSAVLDDFHGPLEWENVVQQFGRVFPDRPIVRLTPDHPVFHCFYQLDEYPQVPGVGSFIRGRMWEKGGFEGQLHAIEDDAGRAMVLINVNTDMGDGWEWSNAEEYAGYVVHTANAYRMGINQVIYSLTH